MTALYSVRLRDQSGAYVTWFDHWWSLTYIRRVNNFDTHAFVFRGDRDEVGLFELDGQLEVWRQPSGEAWVLDYEGLHRTGYRSVGQDGLERFVSYGRGYEDLLNRRVILGFKGTAFTEKAGVAETVLKELVNEQCVAGAIFRVVTGLSMEADAAAGNAIEIKAAWRNLLEVLQEFAWDVGDGDFSVAGTGAATFEFRWHDGQFGLDRTVGNGVNPVAIFSQDHGTLRLSLHGTARTGEYNAVYVAGSGEGATRPLELRTDAAAIALSPWNRVEVFRDGGNSAATATLQDKGDAALIKGQAKEKFTFQMVESAAMQYGVDFDLGDLVTVRFDDTTVNKQIAEVQVTVSGSGEKIVPKVIDR